MCLRLFIAALLVSSHATYGRAETKSPNVIVIVADDLGWADLGCYGSTFYETPNLDGLAKSGVRFTDAYATCPVCSPSRASIMTGKYPARLGMTAHIGAPGPDNWRRETPLKPAAYQGFLPHKETTLAELFHDAGYATMHAGKWHLGHEPYWPEYHGFDVNVAGWSQGGPFGGKQYYSPYGNPRIDNGPEGEYLTDRLAAETTRFIEAHRHEPFFIHLAFYQVHVPLVGRKDLVKKYEDKLAQLPPIEDPWINNGDGRVRARQDLPVYAAMVEAMDEAVGKVLQKLDQRELANNTIIMFTSDNGGLATGDIAISEAEGWPTTNHPLRAGKGWLYEGGIREPTIVRAPGAMQAGATSDHIVTGVDFLPTLLELTQVNSTLPEGVDGKSFASALRGEKSDRGPVFWHYPHYGNQGGRPGAAVRDGQWKLVEWYTPNSKGGGKGDLELYDLANDPSEAINLSTAEPTKRDELHAMLVRWRTDMDAQFPTPNTLDASTPVTRRATPTDKTVN